MRRSFLLLLLAGLLLPTLLLAQSQATTGVIEGTVVDATGAALPGVTVTIRNTDTGYTASTTTDSAGRYRFVLVPLGPYEIRTALEGFQGRVVKGVAVAVGQTITQKIEISQAAVAEEIVVTAAAPLIETARTEGSTRIDQASVEGLPNNGRNF